MFSKACKYGIRALIFITTKSMDEERVTITEISNEIDSPPAFTAKVLQQLVRENMLFSAKGPYGGFYVTEGIIENYNLYNLVEAIDGDAIYHECALGLKECSPEQPCPLHDKFTGIRMELKKLLVDTTLKDLAQQIKNGDAVLKILDHI